MMNRQTKHNEKIEEEIRQALLANDTQALFPQNLPDAWLKKLHNDYITSQKPPSNRVKQLELSLDLAVPLMIVGQLCMVKRNQNKRSFNVSVEDLLDSLYRYGLAIKAESDARANGRQSRQCTLEELG